MALSITPAVSGAHTRWWRDTALYFGGAALGSLATIFAVSMAVLAIEQGTGRRIAVMIACLVAALGLLHEVGLPVPVPYRKRQVPETWRTDLPSGVMSFLYGLTLGTGLLTLFTSSTHLTFVVLAPFSSLPAVIAAVTAYGVGKTLVLLVATGTTSHDEVLGRVVAGTPSRAGLRIRRVLGAGYTALMIGLALHFM